MLFSKVGSREFIKTQKIKAKGASLMAISAFSGMLTKRRAANGLNADGNPNIILIGDKS
jgi:hypothetical protein